MNLFNKFLISSAIIIFSAPITDATEKTEPMLITSDTVISEDLEFDHSAFVIKGSDITLDLNGHTVKFGNKNTVKTLNRDFEDWINDTPKNWTVVSGAVSKTPAIYFGTSDLLVKSGGGVLRSSTITLPANRTFMPFAFVKSNENNTSTIKIVKVSDGSVLASRALTSQYLARGYASNGDPTSEPKYNPTIPTDIYLELELTGTDGDFTVGMVDIKKAYDYGVVANNYKNNTYHPDIPDGMLGGASNITIKNGTLQQVNESVRSVGIRAAAGVGWTLENVTILMNGINTNGIEATSFPIKIEGCKITSTSKSVFNRMHGTAGIFLKPPTDDLGGSIINENIIDGVPQFGLFMYSCFSEKHTKEIDYITNNIIKQKEVVTEGYAIAISGVKDMEISGNTITPYQGRGVLIDAASGCNTPLRKGTENINIFNNNISNINEVRNFEYDENGLETAGFRIRNWGAENQYHRNLKIHDNLISGFTDSTHVHAVYGINTTVKADQDNIEIYDNSITTTAIGTDKRATALAFQGTDLNGTNALLFHDNTLTSNREFLRFGGNDGENARGFSIYNNHLEFPDDIPVAAPHFIGGFWIGEVEEVFVSGNTYTSTILNPQDVANWSMDAGSSGIKTIALGGTKVQISTIDERTDKTSPLNLVLTLEDSAEGKLLQNNINNDHTTVLFKPQSVIKGTTSYTESPSENCTLKASTSNLTEKSYSLTNEKWLTIIVTDDSITIRNGTNRPQILKIKAIDG